MIDFYIALYPFVFGSLLIIFNKKLVRFQTKLQKERNRTVNEYLVKTQLYITGGFLLIIGLLNLGWATGFFGK